MATTAEGRRLTEAHRRRQIAIAAQAEVVGRALWAGLDVTDLDATTPAWLASNLLAAERFHTQSVDAATEYVGRYRAAEIGSTEGPVIRPAFATLANREILQASGPLRIKLLIGKGIDPGSAHKAAVVKFSGIYRRQALEGGRMMIAETGGADERAIGWRRVTDGDPCTFCAMLASRGPAYGSRKKATETGEGLRYHGHCGCTAEIIYGDWQPTAAEQVYIDQYRAAADEAEAAGLPRTEENVLWRMRRDGDFRDSASRRATTE